MPYNPIRLDRRSTILGLAALVGGSSSSAIWAENRKLRVVTEEWPPYNFLEDGVLKGFSVEIVQAISERLKLPVSVEILPSMRTTLMLGSVPWTMMITMLRTPEREQRYKWIGPLGDGAIYFYKKNGNPLEIANLDDAKKVRLIGCRHAGLVFNTLKSAGFTNLDPTSTDGESVYRKLLLDRCDLAISDTHLGVKHVLKKMEVPANALVQTGVQVVGAPLYIACSLDIPDREIALWQRTLDELKASGVFAAIQKKYGE
ncbi:substrate-binding periplasmic protein [Rhodoferax sp.]|uniref:substrate-binding periplasmic protein n=1 Tax=Rhodoferax sp. TaxID=50421 RepID=UPI002ACE95FD|nr:transporter substrate-binding domain-containing protein [Rhodoferax sp.]MDZ7919551.1 transporter substrate-binding domain-containing protein [Rhodoferax sp.]